MKSRHMNFREQLDSLDLAVDDPVCLRENAGRLGAFLFPGPGGRADAFADEVTDLCLKSTGVDFLLVYNTGGFGGAAMADDPEWPTVMSGVREELGGMGYRSMMVEHVRAEAGFGGFLDELGDLRHNYARKARELAAKMAFLAGFNAWLRIILTGRCFGGVMCNEVMGLSESEPRLYSIQASIPFWYTEPVGPRSLVLPDNGVMPDMVRRGGVARFLWTLFRANWRRLPSVSPPAEGGFKAVIRYLKAPGHTYTWDHPGVGPRIVSFLREKFST